MLWGSPPLFFTVSLLFVYMKDLQYYKTQRSECKLKAIPLHISWDSIAIYYLYLEDVRSPKVNENRKFTGFFCLKENLMETTL